MSVPTTDSPDIATDTLEEVLTRAVGVLSLVADVVGQHVELTDPSKDALSSLAGESRGKLATFTDALPGAIQCQPANAWGDRAACLVESKRVVETIEQYGTGRGGGR